MNILQIEFLLSKNVMILKHGLLIIINYYPEITSLNMRII